LTPSTERASSLSLSTVCEHKNAKTQKVDLSIIVVFEIAEISLIAYGFTLPYIPSFGRSETNLVIIGVFFAAGVFLVAAGMRWKKL
jgi:hypothetical protein